MACTLRSRHTPLLEEQALLTNEPDTNDTDPSSLAPPQNCSVGHSTSKCPLKLGKQDYVLFCLQPIPAAPRRRLSAHAQADVDRAIQRTQQWVPDYERRQSWSREDMKHELHIMAISTISTCSNFTEKSSDETPKVRS
ncbi:hypothetical protein BGZ63DRAFT_403276 [Mariannaea sp. PMI_226]|nr:hypothetical protein BGZ63DRAFT_403276 [Mariannaea sp. PMI_226]